MTENSATIETWYVQGCTVCVYPFRIPSGAQPTPLTANQCQRFSTLFSSYLMRLNYFQHFFGTHSTKLFLTVYLLSKGFPKKLSVDTGLCEWAGEGIPAHRLLYIRWCQSSGDSRSKLINNTGNTPQKYEIWRVVTSITFWDGKPSASGCGKGLPIKQPNITITLSLYPRASHAWSPAAYAAILLVIRLHSGFTMRCSPL